MAFSLPFFGKKRSEQYFGLFITATSVCGLIIQKESVGLKVLKQVTKQFGSGLDSFLYDIDDLLTQLEDGIDDSITKTVFFLPTSFLDKETKHIREPYTAKIDEISEKLNLDAIGYIDVQEALAPYFSAKSKPVIAIENNDKGVYTYIFQDGKVHHHQQISEDKLLPYISALEKTTLEHGKFWIVSYGDEHSAKTSEQIQQHLAGTNFTEKPMIENLQFEELQQHVLASFAKELKVAMQPGAQKPLEAQSESPDEAVSPKPALQDTSASQTASGAAFGFAMGADIQQTDSKFGFSGEENSDPLVDKTSEEPSKLSFLSNFSLPSMNMPKISIKNPRNAAVGLVAIMVLIGALIAYEYFFHKVQLTITMPSEETDSNYQLTMSLDPDADGLRAERRSLNTPVSESTTVTGEKEVGERASGTVRIYSFEERDVDLASGTTIEVNGLEFLLDSSVSLASASSQISGGKKTIEPETADASVTAADIGDSYNISEGSELSVASFAKDALYAVAKANFSGGKSETVRTVARADLDKLDKKTEESVKGASAENILDVAKDEFVLGALTTTQLENKEYSKEVDEEADKVSISAVLTTEYYVVNKKELLTFIQKRLEEDLDDGMKINTDSIEYDIVDVEENEDEIDINIDVTAVAYEKVEEENLVAMIRGKTVRGANERITNEMKVKSIEVADNPLPFYPFFQKNIQYEIKTD